MIKQIIHYERVLEPRQVDFICARCGRLATRLMLPGPKPKYCDECKVIIKREHNRERQARFQHRKQAAQQAKAKLDQSSD